MARRLDVPRARGPKGWRRPDERILDELCATIVAAGLDASEVQVTVERGEVWLEGVAADPAQRDALRDLAERVLGVTAVHAELRLEGEDGAEGEDEPDPETRH